MAGRVDAYAVAIVEQLHRLGEPADAATVASESGLKGVHVRLVELHDEHAAATRAVMGSWEGTGAGEANSRAAALHARLATIADNAHTALGALREADGRVRAGAPRSGGSSTSSAPGRPGWTAPWSPQRRRPKRARSPKRNPPAMMTTSTRSTPRSSGPTADRVPDPLP